MEILAAFGILCYIPILIVGGTLWRAYVGTKLWLWFVIPQFGLAPLPIAEAIGLSALIALYSSHSSPAKDSDATALGVLGKAAARVALLPAIGLVIGWIVHEFQ